MLAELAKEAGLPDGVLNIVHGTNDIVNAICDDDDIRAISFVGSNTNATVWASAVSTLAKFGAMVDSLKVRLLSSVLSSSILVMTRFKNLQKILLIYQWGKMKANQVGSFSSRPGSIDYDSGRHFRKLGNPVMILPPTTYIFFASAIPVISFGEQLDRNTEGPDLGHKLFLPWTGWVCVWTAILLFLLAILGACSIINRFTRVAGELFGLLIAMLFMQQAVKE
ncbi:Boron transporter 1 [Camellia lanceoleosa]|nr:Boron transporter 1 [Camellia lanceoleosa]